MYKAGTVEVEHLPCLDAMLPCKEFAVRLELSRLNVYPSPFQRGREGWYIRHLVMLTWNSSIRLVGRSHGRKCPPTPIRTG
jgi:hypothetical protein